jgi:hypothetical protein
MARQKQNDQPVFEVRVNLIYHLHAKHKLAALDAVVRPLALLNPPGGITRAVKWSDVQSAEEQIPKSLTKKGGESGARNTEVQEASGAGREVEG